MQGRRFTYSVCAIFTISLVAIVGMRFTLHSVILKSQFDELCNYAVDGEFKEASFLPETRYNVTWLIRDFDLKYLTPYGCGCKKIPIGVAKVE